MSYTSTLKKIDEMGKDFNAVVQQWKHHIEHDCKKKKSYKPLLNVRRIWSKLFQRAWNRGCVRLKFVICG